MLKFQPGKLTSDYKRTFPRVQTHFKLRVFELWLGELTSGAASRLAFEPKYKTIVGDLLCCRCQLSCCEKNTMWPTRLEGWQLIVILCQFDKTLKQSA